MLLLKSNAIIDYAGGSEQIGTINKFAASQYVPKLDNETNTLSLMNAKVYDKAEKSIIILDYNNEYILFEKINE